LKIGYNRFVQTAAAWSRSPPDNGRWARQCRVSCADVERDLFRTRTSKGRERAKARGVKLGRKPKLTEHQKRTQ
jgi:DNA invertase Pin-like site-specific DNA recombinase